MAEELVYTSVQKGIRPGTTGFCTVAHTRGMRREAIHLVESLSAYRPLHQGGVTSGIHSPVTYSHYRFTLGGENVSVLSRVAPSSADHTQRANKIAHHVLIRDHERPEAGPAWLARQPDFFITSWDDTSRVIEEPKEIPAGRTGGSTHAATWERVTGDAGWAGVLAQAFEADPRNPAYILADPDMDIMPLLDEAVTLVRPKNRWRVTFHTMFQEVPPGTQCVWRCCRPGGNTMPHAHRGSVVIDLRHPGPCSKQSRLVRCAREGIPLEQIYGGDPSHDRNGKNEHRQSAAGHDHKDATPKRRT